MTKKVLLSILLAIFVFCGVFGATFANAEEPAETPATTSYKVATFDMKATYGETGYPANTTMELTNGSAVVGSLTVDRENYVSSFDRKPQMAGYSVFTLVPTEGYALKAILFASTEGKTGITVDAEYGTKIDNITNDQATQDLLTQEGIPFNKSYTFGVNLNAEFVASQATPYTFSFTSSACKMGTVVLIYEKLPYSETVSTNRTTYSNVQTGGAKLNIGSTGYRDGSSVVINSRDKIDVIPKAGFVIVSITFDANKQGLSFTSTPDDNLTLTYKGTNAKSRHDFELTGFQPGQTYVLESSYYTYYQLYNVTVTYIEHEHAQGDLVLEHDETNHWYKCTVCNGTNIGLQAHDLVDGEITKQPDNGDGLPGEQLQTCQVCDYKTIKYLPCSITDPGLTVELASQLRYNGQAQAQKVIIKAGDVELVEGVDYTLSNNGAIDIDNYTLTITGIGNYYGTRTMNFSVEKGQIALPDPGQTEFQYNGQSQSYNLPTSAYYKITGTKYATNVGSYEVKLTLVDTRYYEWRDGSTSSKTYKWKINKGIVPEPAPDTSIYYFSSVDKGGYYSVQSYKYQVPASDLYYAASTGEYNSSRAYPGEYKVAISLRDKNNYVWENSGNNKDLYYDFVIHMGVFDMNDVVFEDTTVTYDGNPHSLEVQNLPSNVRVTYENNGQIALGTYQIIAHFSPDDTANASYYEEIPDMSATLTISKASIAKPAADPTEFVYNGLPQTYNLATNDLLYTISGDGLTQTNAGEYTITVRLNNPADCQWEGGSEEDLVYTFVIEKATYDMSNVVFADQTVTYTGSKFYLEATNLPDGVSVSYDNNGQTNAGTYTVTAIFTGDAANYNTIEPETATLTINKATYDMRGVVFEGKTVTYNGNEHPLAITGILPDGVSVSYENNDNKTVGEYTVTAIFTGDSTNYNSIDHKTATLTINKATYDMRGVEFKDTKVTYNGKAQSILATNLPAGVTVTYTGNEQTVIGEYTVTANFVGDSENYNTIDPKTATLTIVKANIAKPAIDTTSFVYTGSNLTYEIALNDLYTVSGNVQKLAGNYKVTVVLKNKDNCQWTDGSTDDLEYKFVIAKATYDMSGVEFKDTTVIYNGESHSILATNLPAGVTASYTGNGKTVVGKYEIEVEFAGDATNYNAIADMTATLTINKATYDMGGVTFVSKTVKYDASEHEVVLTGTLPTGVTVSYTNNKGTNAGIYNAVATFAYDSANYNAIADMTATLTINKANVEKPEADTTSFVYNTNAQTYTVAQSDLYTVSGNVQTKAGTYSVAIALNDEANYQWADGSTDDLYYSFVIAKANVAKPEADTTSFVYNTSAQTYTVAPSDLYTVSGNVQTNAGNYTVTVTLKDKANYQWADGSTDDLYYSFVIAKATYDMSGVTFVSKTVKYNASEHEVVLTGTLPAGVTVSYINNKGTNAGIYNAVATFAYDSANYNAIADMTATLTINRDVQSHVNPETNKQEVIVSSEEGIDPTKDLVVELVEKEVSDEAYDEFLQDNQKVAVAYDIKLLQNNISVQPDGTITIKILIPQELKNRDFEILHLHEGKNVAVEYRIEGDYAVFETNKLSEFMFVYNMGSILWLVIVLAVIVLMEIGFLLFLSKKQKQSNTTKVLGAYPPFVFGMFIAEWQVILFIALAVAVAVLAVVIIISATKALNKQTAQAVQPAQPLPVEEDDNQKSVRIAKSFSERLSQSSDEVKGFYKAIKDELLSYTTVKSKISFKHETFKVGKNIVAKLKIRGKSLCLFLALDPNDYKGTKYKIRDMAEISNSKDIPTMYKINLPRRVEYAKSLISDVMQKFGAQKNND